mmetsp:Transcript_12549/g.15580  ORF Transcript_12549/g.15580 Transcript_12549/m.15580 type:complete len:86 (+) Transcript_12549:1229-1486(+)
MLIIINHDTSSYRITGDFVTTASKLFVGFGSGVYQYDFNPNIDGVAAARLLNVPFPAAGKVSYFHEEYSNGFYAPADVALYLDPR